MHALLIRHGHTDAVDRWLAGRCAGVPLSATGRAQAAALANALAEWPLTVVYSSPLERALETATPLARACGTSVQIEEPLSDIDFGDWTGRTLAALSEDPAWHAFNACRDLAVAPAGEALITVQRRILHTLHTLAARHPGQMVAIVTHAELIRSALAVALGQTLQQIGAVDIAPASVTQLRCADAEWQVLAVNCAANEAAREGQTGQSAPSAASGTGAAP